MRVSNAHRNHNRQSRKGQLLSEERGRRYGRGAGVGLDRETGVDLGVVVAVGVAVGVGLCAAAQYLPPVLKELGELNPPQTIISLPVQTPVGTYRAIGALVVLVAVQLSVPGSVFKLVLQCIDVN
jgi:hypothetical protein